MRKRSASYILFIDNDPVDTAFTLKQGLKKFHAVKDYVFQKQLVYMPERDMTINEEYAYEERNKNND